MNTWKLLPSLLSHSDLPTHGAMSSNKSYKSDDIVMVRYRFVGLQEETIQCSYFQFKNLKELPDMEVCEIIEENNDSE